MLATVIAHAAEETAPLIAPPIVIATIAAVILLVLLVVVWSYRDIAHRHSDKKDLRADLGADASGTGAGH